MKRIILILSIISLSLFGCTRSLTLEKQTFTIELGQDVFANPALYIKDAENYDTESMSVVAKSRGITKKDNRFVSGSQDYLVVGEYDFELQDGKKSYSFKIKIKDTQPPTVTKSVNEITVGKGTIVNWNDYFSASDISGVSYSTSPLLDTSNEGDYAILVKIADRFGNSQEKEVTVHVS